jgi:hypothetical protein
MAETTRSIRHRRQSPTLGAPFVHARRKSFGSPPSRRSRQRAAYFDLAGATAVGTSVKELNPWPCHCHFQKFKNCMEIPLGRQKLKVLSLERILVSKIAANRAKDKLTIPVLRDAMAVTQLVKQRAKKKYKRKDK